MTILCCGDRRWKDRDVIARVLSEFPSGSTVVHGDCRGADRMCADVALGQGFTVLAFPAAWNIGFSAGPLRNQEMLDSNHIDLVVAFHGDIESSKGTADMVRRARAAQIPVRIETGASQ